MMYNNKLFFPDVIKLVIKRWNYHLHHNIYSFFKNWYFSPIVGWLEQIPFVPFMLRGAFLGVHTRTYTAPPSN